jgi:hypothetical protein
MFLQEEAEKTEDGSQLLMRNSVADEESGFRKFSVSTPPLSPFPPVQKTRIHPNK